MNFFDDNELIPGMPIAKDTAHTKEHWLGNGFKADSLSKNKDMEIPKNSFKVTHIYNNE